MFLKIIITLLSMHSDGTNPWGSVVRFALSISLHPMHATCGDYHIFSSFKQWIVSSKQAESVKVQQMPSMEDWERWRADHSSRGVLPTVVHRCVWSRKPQEWGGHEPRWVAAPQKKKDWENRTRVFGVISWKDVGRVRERMHYLTICNRW